MIGVDANDNINEALVFIYDHHNNIICVGVLMDTGNVIADKNCIDSESNPMIKSLQTNQMYNTIFTRVYHYTTEIRVSNLVQNLHPDILCSFTFNWKIKILDQKYT